MLLAFSLRNLLPNWMKKCTGFYIMTDICCMRDCFIRDFSWFPVSSKLNIMLAPTAVSKLFSLVISIMITLS